jgi:hypothetical protein
MLIAILIFILASVFIVSLVTNALDKPKEAGILNDFNHYEQAGTLLLKSTENITESQLNSGTDKQAQFIQKDGSYESTKKNAYNNPYVLTVEEVVSPVQTAVVVKTKGKSQNKEYKLVIVKEGKVVESCTSGFGRNNKELPTLKSPLCGDSVVVEPEDTFTPVAVVPDGCIVVYTAEDMDKIREDMGGCYTQMNSIDLSTYPNWIPIYGLSGQSFTGSFDGQRYQITGLTITDLNTDYLGLFEESEGATFENVVLENIDITGGSSIGGLVSYADTTLVKNSTITGIINSPTGSYTGGVIAESFGVTIEKTSTDIEFRGNSVIGGLIGSTYDVVISDSASSGSIVGEDSLGGLVGQMLLDKDTSTIQNSHSTVSILSNSDWGIGGLIGYASNVDVLNSYATGNIEDTLNPSDSFTAGGLIGSADNISVVDSYSTGLVSGHGIVGGFIGEVSEDVFINNSYASGNVVNKDAIVNTSNQHSGGFIGSIEADSIVDISNSYATGNITNELTGSSDTAGGFIGVSLSPIKVTNTYSIGSVTGSTTINGYLGYSDSLSDITNSYYNKDNTINTATTYGEPKTTAELKQQSTYTGFDFTTIWKIDGTNYTSLR